MPEEVGETIEGRQRKYGALNGLEANVYLHEHDEKLRGTPLDYGADSVVHRSGTFRRDW